MLPILLFIKTYREDFAQCEKLLRSIQTHNRDNIKILLSVNDEDFSFFKNNLPTDTFEIIKDSDILECRIDNQWKYQQIVKSQLHKLNICKNYVCIDSDSFFINDFFVDTFIAEKDIPYTVIHQQKELFSWLSINNKFEQCPKEYFENINRKIMSEIGRSGICYDYGPSPTIWSCAVWESFEKNFLKPRKIVYEQLIDVFPSEFTWYGEWLLHTRLIPLFPKEPLFKVFHYEKQYNDFIKEGHSIESIKENYLGIVMQSNWTKKRKKWYQHLWNNIINGKI